MRRPELVATIAESTGLSKDKANTALEAVLEAIKTAVSKNEKVTLVDFGSFKQRHRGARTGKNPQTGEPVKIKASNTVAFTPGKALKEAINPSAASTSKHASAKKTKK